MLLGDARWNLEDFDFGTVIAKGTFGIVYKAVRKSDGRVFALKQVSLKGMSRVDREEAIDEARMLSQLAHPHVVRHYSSFIGPDEKLNIFMEYAAKGSLNTVIQEQGTAGAGLPEPKVWKYFIQALLGLQYIHSHKIIHRDIKSLNLFLDHNDNIKVGDLGIARALTKQSNFARTLVGTPFYLSPELCEDKPYNERSDVWALGVVLYECCTGRMPFEAQNEGALIRKIIRGAYQPVNAPVSPALVQLVGMMMTFDHRKRPNTTALLQHPVVLMRAKTYSIDLSPRLVAADDVPMVDPAWAPPPPAAAKQQSPGKKAAPARGASARELLAAAVQPALADQPRKSPRGMQPQAPGKHPFELDATDKLLASAMAQAQQQHPYQQQQRPAAGRLAAPEQMPPAGSRPGSSAAARMGLTKPPWAQQEEQAHGPNPVMMQTSSKEQAAAAWAASYQPPQFGRKRCTDITATGPTARGAGKGASRAVSGGYVPAADDATSYATSYNTSYHRGY